MLLLLLCLTSDGPAGMSMPTMASLFCSSILAAVTNWFPGPKIFDTLGHVCVPYAIAATACPPIRKSPTQVSVSKRSCTLRNVLPRTLNFFGRPHPRTCASFESTRTSHNALDKVGL